MYVTSTPTPFVLVAQENAVSNRTINSANGFTDLLIKL